MTNFNLISSWVIFTISIPVHVTTMLAWAEWKCFVTNYIIETFIINTVHKPLDKVLLQYSQIPLYGRLVITDSFQKSPNIFSKFNPLNTDTLLMRTIPTVYAPLSVCLTVAPFFLVVLRNKIWAFSIDSLHPFTIISTAVCYSQCLNSYVFIRAVIKKWGPGISHGYFHRKREEK